MSFGDAEKRGLQGRDWTLGQKFASTYADPPHCPESRESQRLFDGPAPVHPR